MIPKDVRVSLVDGTDQAWAFKRWLGERHANDAVAVDTETTGLDPRAAGAGIRLIQFGDTMHGWAIPWEDWRGLAMEALRQYDGQWIMHNASFEMKWLHTHAPDGYRVPRDRSVDTMIAAHIVDPLGSGALKRIAGQRVDSAAAGSQVVLGEQMGENKWTWATVPITFKPYWSYAALDTILTARVWEQFKSEVGPGGKYADVFDLEMAVRFIVSRMEEHGARVNVDYSSQQFIRLNDEADSVEAWAKDAFGIKISSNDQLGKKLIELGGVLLDKTTTGKPKVDRYTLQVLMDPENGYPTAVQVLSEQALRARSARKFASTYFKNLTEKSYGGLVHADVRTLGARTGRMSVANPPLQQIPKSSALVRNAFVPSAGNVLVTADYSQIEMRLVAEASGDPGLIEAFRTADSTGGDFFVEMGKQVYADPDFKKSDKRRGLIKNCVPLSSRILTKRGWLSHDEVKPGDETMGYDFETGLSRWTEVIDVRVFNDPTPVYKMATTQREVYCTSDHRWVADNGRSGLRGVAPRFVHASDVPGTENRLILAAPAEDGDLDITPDEAALLGWILGDGGIKRGKWVGATSQGRGGWRVKLDVNISQSKPDECAVITSLLDSLGVSSKLYVSDKTGSHQWHLESGYCRDLLSRASIEGKHDFDPWALAAGLTHESRKSMADALNLADGLLKNKLHFAVVQEADSPVAELCVALGFYLGHYSRIRTIEPDGTGWQRKPVQRVYHQYPTVTGQKMTMEHIGDEPVWCVSTELGTWTMRQEHDQVPLITGNTMYGKAYGAGPAKMAESAGVPVARMEGVVKTIEERFPGLTTFMKQIESDGWERQEREGQGYVVTPLGRRLPADENRLYALTNYYVQSWAADILKKALVRLDASGYDQFMVLPVHDEIVIDIPEGYAEQAARDVPILMQELDHDIPLTADADGPLLKWGEKYE